VTYNPRNLSALSYANGFTLWHYRTEDAYSVVVAPGYFDDAHNMVRNGDMVMCSSAIGSDDYRTFIGVFRLRGQRVDMVPIAGEETAP